MGVVSFIYSFVEIQNLQGILCTIFIFIPQVNAVGSLLILYWEFQYVKLLIWVFRHFETHMLHQYDKVIASCGANIYTDYIKFYCKTEGEKPVTEHKLSIS